MSEDKVELSSAELIRQAREALASPKGGQPTSTKVDGPTIQDLLAKPLSSDSLLPQRAVDYWDEDNDESAEPWAPIEHASESSGEPARSLIRKRAFTENAGAALPSPSEPPGVSQQPPPAVPPNPPGAPWSEPIRDEWGLPPMATRVPVPAPSRAPRPLGPPARQSPQARVPWRFIFIGLVALGVAISSFATNNITSARQIEVGDCYDSAALTDVVDCAQPHRVQVIAVVNVVGNATSAADRCFNEAVLLREVVGFPATATIPDGTFVGAVGAPDGLAGNTVCYFESPASGLIGSVLRD